MGYVSNLFSLHLLTKRKLIINVGIGRTRAYLTDMWNIIEFFNLVVSRTFSASTLPSLINKIFIASIIMYLAYLGSNRTDINFARSDYIVELEHIGRDAIQFYQLSAISIF